MHIVHTLSVLILMENKGMGYGWGHWGGLRVGNKGKVFRVGKREEGLEVWKRVNGGGGGEH